MLDKKIIFNITFHHQLDILKYHLQNLFSWSHSDKLEYIITTAHKDNLEAIKAYIQQNYPNKKVEFVFIPVDYGYNLGTIKNVTEGIRYIKDNKAFDFLVNVEADNMFYFEDRFLDIIQKMISQEKHVLLIEEGFGKTPHSNFPERPDVPKYFHFTTLNIFSQYYIENYFPFEYYEDIIDIRWVGRPHTPYEVYMGLATMKKNNLTEQNQMEFYEKVGLRLDYDRNANPLGWSEPDNMVPEKFLNWGIINAPSTAGGAMHGDWRRLLDFVKLHLPLKK